MSQAASNAQQQIVNRQNGGNRGQNNNQGRQNVRVNPYLRANNQQQQNAQANAGGNRGNGANIGQPLLFNGLIQMVKVIVVK